MHFVQHSKVCQVHAGNENPQFVADIFFTCLHSRRKQSVLYGHHLIFQDQTSERNGNSIFMQKKIRILKMQMNKKSVWSSSSRNFYLLISKNFSTVWINDVDSFTFLALTPKQCESEPSQSQMQKCLISTAFICAFLINRYKRLFHCKW